MQPQDILNLLRSEPFEPFVIHLSDGSSYEVRHPAMAIVDRTQMFVSWPAHRSPDKPADKTVRLSLLHINRVVPSSREKGGTRGA